MGRDLQLKSMMFIFSLVALLSMSACAVSSAPLPEPEVDEEAGSEIREPSSTAESEPSSEQEPDPREDDGEREEDQSSAAESRSDSLSPDAGSESRDDIGSTGATDGESTEQTGATEDDENAPGNPVRLQIDAIDVDAAFEYVGQTDEGDMDVPQEWDNVAWYEPGTVPGDQGNAVVAGHYDSETGPAVFIDLNELSPGDEIQIMTGYGEELVFEVTEVESVHIDDADPKKIFGASDERNLNLITCEGVWDSSSRMYDKRLIVYSTLVSE